MKDAQDTDRQPTTSPAEEAARSPEPPTRPPVTRIVQRRQQSGVTGAELMAFQDTLNAPRPNPALTESLTTLRYFTRSAALSPDDPSAREIAARGVAGAGAPVASQDAARFQDTTGSSIQHAREHTGPDAAEACDALGVQAYTLGEQVAYRAASPSPHVRFHELAHVAQGAQGPQGYGAGRATLEANADAVADAALRGERAPITPSSGALAYLDWEDGQRGQQLADRIAALGGRRYKQAEQATALLGLLSGYDRATILALLRDATEKNPKLPEMLAQVVKALATTSAGQAHPREAIGLIAACPSDARLQGARDAAQRENPSIELFWAAMTEEEQQTLRLEHPDAIDTSEAAEARRARQEQVRGAQDERARAAHEARQGRLAEAQEADAERAEAAAARATEADGAALIEALKAQIAAGSYEAALGALGRAQDPTLFDAAVRALDDGGQLRALLSGLDFDVLWNSRPTLVRRLLAARDPERNAREALELLRLEALYTANTAKRSARRQKRFERKGGDPKGRLTPDKAYTAFQLIKALPPAHRECVERLYPDLMVKLHQSLNASMRAADDTNFFGTDAQGAEALDAHVARLAEDALWVEGSPTELKMTLTLVLKGGRRDVIAARLEAMGAETLGAVFRDEARRGAVEAALGIAPAEEAPPSAEAWRTRLSVNPKALNTDLDTLQHGSIVTFAGGRHGVTSALMQANRAQRREARQANRERRQAKRRGEEVGERVKHQNLVKQAFKKNGALEVENLPLDQLQWAIDQFAFGGDVAFHDYGKRRGDNRDNDNNRADIAIDPDAGTLRFACCGDLVLDRLRFPTGGTTVDAGTAIMRGLTLDATFPTAHNPDQAQTLVVAADSIEIADIALTWPGMMVGLDQLSAAGLLLHMDEAATSLDEHADLQSVMQLVAEQNPARRMLTSIVQFIGWGTGVSGIEGNAAGELTETLGNLATTFQRLPPEALGGVGIDVMELSTRGVIVNDTAFVEEAQVTDLRLLQDSRPTVVAEARQAQIARQRAFIEAELDALDPTTDEGAERLAQLHGQLGELDEEVTRLTRRRSEWTRLEALWQAIYEAQRLLGEHTPEATETVARLRAQAVEAGFEDAETLTLAEIADRLHVKLTADAGMIASVGSATTRGVSIKGHAAVGEAGTSGVELSMTGAPMGEDPGVGAATRERLGGIGTHAPNETTGRATAFAQEIHAEQIHSPHLPASWLGEEVEQAQIRGLSGEVTRTRSTQEDGGGRDVMVGHAQVGSAEVTGAGRFKRTRIGALEADASHTELTTREGDALVTHAGTAASVCAAHTETDSEYGEIAVEDLSATGYYGETTRKKEGEEAVLEDWTASAAVNTGAIKGTDPDGHRVGASELAIVASTGRAQPTKVHAEATGLVGALGKDGYAGATMQGEAGVERLVFDAEGPSGEALRQGDFSGPLKVTVAAGPIVLPEVSYAGGSMSLRADGAKAAALTCTAQVTLAKGAEGGYTVSALEIEALDWPHVEVDGLVITIPVQGESVEISLPCAELETLTMRCVHLNGLSLEALKEAPGEVTIEKVRAELGEQLPYGLKATGALSLDHLWAKGVSSGAMDFGLDALTLEDLGIDPESAREAAVEQSPLLAAIIARGGRVSHKGVFTASGSYHRKENTLSATVGLGDIGLKEIHYVADGTRLDVTKADLKNAAITAAVDLSEETPKVTLASVTADALVGDGIVYVGEAETVERDERGEIKRYPDGEPVTHTEVTRVELPHGALTGLKATGLESLMSDHGALGVSVQDGTLEGFKATLERDGLAYLETSASATVQELKVNVGRSGGAVTEVGAEIKRLDGGAVDATVGNLYDPDNMVRAHANKVGADQVAVHVTDLGTDKQRTRATAEHVEAFETDTKLGYGQGSTHIEGNVTGDGFELDQTKDATTATLKEAHAYNVDVNRGDQHHTIEEATVHGASYTSRTDAEGNTTQSIGVERLELDDVEVRAGARGVGTWFEAHLPEALVTGVDAKIVAQLLARDVPGANPGMPDNMETTTTNTTIKVNQITTMGEGGEFTLGWPEAQEQEPYTIASKQAALDAMHADNAAARELRDAMRDDDELGDLLSLINGQLSITMESGATSWLPTPGPGTVRHTVVIGINNGRLDLSGVTVAGGAGIDVDWSYDEEGRLIAVIDAVGFADLYTLAELSGPGGSEFFQDNMAAGQALSWVIDEGVALQDLIATQATPMVSDDTIDAFQNDVDRIDRIDDAIDDLIAEMHGWDHVILRSDPRTDLEGALAELDAYTKQIDHERLESLKRRLKALVRAYERQIEDRNEEDPSWYGHLSMTALDADIHWGRPDGEPVRFRGMDIGAQDVHLDFQPQLGGATYTAQATVSGLSVAKADGSFKLSVGEADVGVLLERFLPGSRLDIIGNDGEGISNPIQAPLTTGARIRDVEIGFRSVKNALKSGE